MEHHGGERNLLNPLVYAKRPWRVLVIDDALEAAEGMARMLEALGHTASFVINPLDALDAAEGIQPEAACIDLDMPKIDGWRLARLLRERFGAELRLIAVTGLDRPADRERSRLAGFDAHLVKPVSTERIECALQQRPAPAAA
jgi:CheY-like chemotaxis protein